MEWAFANISQLARGGSAVLVFAFGSIGLAQAQVAVPLINPLQFVYLQPSTVQRPLSFSGGNPRSDFELFDTGSFVYSAPNLPTSPPHSATPSVRPSNQPDANSCFPPW